MAELAIGISKPAVEALVNKVKTAFKEEEELWQTVERDVVFIQDEFEMMESFLRTADTQRVKSNVRSTWVRQVWDLSQQMEDCADFIRHLEKRSRWRVLLRLLPSWCKPRGEQADPLAEAVAKIKLLKARVEEVSQRNSRYNLVGDSAYKEETAVVIQQEMTDGSCDILEATKHHRGPMDLTKLLITKEDMDLDLQVISVWGTRGDHGKLSIIMKAYHESRINKSFKCCAWVKLVYPFSPHDFIDNVMAQFYNNSCRQQQEQGASLCQGPLSRLETSASALANEFKKLVDNNRYLIVLEDVSSVAQWHAIRAYLPVTKNGSRIIVSTHQIEIASLCAGQQYGASELRRFSPEHSVWVFFKEQSWHQSEDPWTCPPVVDRDCMVNFTIVGRDREVRELSGMIEHGGRVLSVCGTSGVGKSTVVQAVCNDAKYKFRIITWVNVSHLSHPFDPMDFSHHLLKNSWNNILSPFSDVSRDNAIRVSRYYFKNFRSLVVIDGLWSKDDWNWIERNAKFIRSEDNCIIVITTEDSVARQCADTVYKIDPLKEDDAALDVVLRQALHFESYLNKDKDKIVKYLLSLCCGFPKRIEALASYLDWLVNQPRDIQEMYWKRLNYSCMSESELSMESCETLQKLYSSFEACPQVLKRCIFYLQIFLETSNIRRGRLVRRWMAEGYSQDINSNSLEEAKKLFHKIADDDFRVLKRAQPPAAVPGMRSAPWEINSFFLEHIVSWQTEEKIFLPLEVTVLAEKSSLATRRIGQHLSIGNGKSWLTDEIVFSSLDFSRLRSLTVSGDWQSFFVSDKMSVLRVLDLEDSRNVKVDDLDKIFEMVPHLKFLSLRKCIPFSQLPASLGTLSQLQTLDIRDTSVKELPRGITKLYKLEYIRAGTANGSMPAGDHQSSSSTQLVGVSVPRGIGRLKSLFSLGAVDVSTAESGKAILAELHNHKQLKKLHMSCTNSSIIKVLQSGNLRFPQNLMKLKIEVPRYSLCCEVLQANWKLEKKIQTLHIRVEEIQDVLLNVLFCMQKPFGAGTSFGKLEVMGILEYEVGAAPEQPKLTIRMPTYSLCQAEIEAVGKIEQVHTVCIDVKEIHGGLPNVLLCMPEQVGAGPKVIKIVCSLDTLDLEYKESAASDEHRKLLTVKMAKLMPEDIRAIGKLKNMHTIHISAQEFQVDLPKILCSMQQQFDQQLKYAEVIFESKGCFVYNQGKVEVKMPTDCLRQEDVLAILTLEKINELRISAEKIEGQINSLVHIQEQGDAGSSLAQPFGQLSSFEIQGDFGHCHLEYSRNEGKHKLVLYPFGCGLEESDIENLGKLKWLHTLELRLFYEECDGELLFGSRSCGPDHFGQLKELQIASGRSVHVKFMDQVMKELEVLKIDSVGKSATLQFSGLECLPSLKEVCLRGEMAEELKENLRNQLDRRPAQERPALKDW